MSQITITIDSKKGVVEVLSTVTSISHALDNAALMTRTAAAIRLLHQSAKEPSSDLPEEPLPTGRTPVFRCGCGRLMYSAEAAIIHVECSHASAAIRRDIDELESTIESLITPSPLPNWSDKTLPILGR